jgi:hypothetical protein
VQFVHPLLETLAQLNCNSLVVADTPKHLLFPLLLVGRQDGPCNVIESRVLGFTQASSLEVIVKVPQESSQQQIFVHVMNKNFVGRYKQQSFSVGTKMDRVHIDECAAYICAFWLDRDGNAIVLIPGASGLPGMPQAMTTKARRVSASPSVSRTGLRLSLLLCHVSHA